MSELNIWGFFFPHQDFNSYHILEQKCPDMIKKY